MWGLILTIDAGIVGTAIDYYEPKTQTAHYNTARYIYICAAGVLIGFMLMAVSVPH
jgi:hypothetical protein